MQRLSFFLVLGATLMLLFVGYFHEVDALTQDLGRHILTGNIILSNYTIPHINLFSYTFPSYEFINHHWLSEVIFALVYSYAKYEGLMAVTLLLISSSILSIFIYLRKKAHPFSLFIASLLYLPILFERTDIRPELFSFFFLSLFITILHFYREHFTRVIFILPVLSFLWTNSHIYFPIGVGVTALFLLDEIITHRHGLRNKHTLTLGVILLFCIGGTLLNPNGVKGAIYPFTVFSNYGYSIEENQTPFFLHSLGIEKLSFTYLLISIATLFSSLSLTIKKTKPIDWFLSLSFSIFSLMAVRNFPLFVFATFIPFSLALSHLIKKIVLPNRFPPIVPLFCSIVVGGVFVFTLLNTMKKNHTGFSLPQGATKALDFYQENNLSGPLFNNFDIGSYIEYRLYPQEKVFIDGRPEAYPKEFIQQVYIPMQESSTLFKEQEKKYHFNTIIFSHTDMTPWAETFLSSIVKDSSWKPVYLDPMILILVKDTPANKLIINQHAQPLSTLPVQHVQSPSENTNHSLALAHFFRLVELPDREKTYLQQILHNNPSECYALSRLYQLTPSSPLASYYSQQFESSCR